MKFGQFFKKVVGGSMILAALATPAFTSCADFGAELEDMKADITDLENRVTALEEKLNTDLAALQTLLEGKIEALDGRVDVVEGDLTDLISKVNGLVTVKNVKTNSNGTVDVTLTDGTKFTVQPETDYSGLVTTTAIDGVLYWAVIGADGVAKAVEDADGNLVPVVDAVPQVKNEDGFFYISFDGGETWEATGVTDPCVFTDAEVVYTDNYTDEEEATGWYEETPMYVVLTLADGNTITVTLDGVASFMFGGHLGGVSTVQYITAGTTKDIAFMTTNIQEWIKEVPTGWTVTEIGVENAQYGGASFRVTAPTEEAIASGAAVAEGMLKVLAIAEGGKSVSASLKLTTKAFNNVMAGKGAITVEVNNGVAYYIVGIADAETYNPEAIVAELKPVVEEIVESNWGNYPAWDDWTAMENATTLDDNCFSYSITDYPIADLNSVGELELGKQYVVWALSINMWEDADYNYGYLVGSITSTPYNNVSVEVETTALAFNDIQISAEFKGVTAFYGGFNMLYSDVLNKKGILDEFNSSLNSSWGAPTLFEVNDEFVEGWDSGVYTGDPNTLVSGWQTIEPGSSYYLYIIPAVEGKTEYTMADVYWFEWATDPLMEGGSANLSETEAILDMNRITVGLEASEDDAVYVYYSFVEPEKVSTIEDKAAYLIENGYRAEGAVCEVMKSGIKPNTTYTLLAIAVDKNGFYGEVFQKNYTSKSLEYSSVTVSAQVVGTPAAEGYVKLSASGDVQTYIYWYGLQEDYFWTNDYYFGGSAESASSYIALNPDMYFFTKVDASELPAEGVLIEDLTVGSSHVFVVSAQLADGSFTKATVVDFVPKMDLGNFVYAKDENGNANPVWEAAKPTVEYEIDSLGDFTIVTWTLEVPEGFTGKTACVSEEYLTNYPTAKDVATYILTGEYAYAEEIVEGATYSNYYASKGYNIYTVLCDADGNYYETYVTKLNITGGFGV